MIIDDKEKMRQFNEEWDRAHSTSDTQPPLEVGNNASADSLMDSIASQNMNQPVGNYAPPPIPTTGDRCDQCKTLHPPLKPGEKCPVAEELAQKNPQPPVQPVTEGNTLSNVKPVNEAQQRPITSPPSPKTHDLTPASARDTWDPVEPEPAPLAQNNIPTEIHINKYLKLWSDMLEAHCKTHNVDNVKKLMRHITVEINEFLGWYKGK